MFKLPVILYIIENLIPNSAKSIFDNELAPEPFIKELENNKPV